MIFRAGTHCGHPMALGCDARCDKAWGISNRPQVQLSDDDDDIAYLADDEVGTAPTDPGTYEGGHAKPRTPEDRLNKWCARECERSASSDPFLVQRDPGRYSLIATLPDFSRRRFNQPWKHPDLCDADGRGLDPKEPQ